MEISVGYWPAHDANGWWGVVIIPDRPDLSVHGDTLDEASVKMHALVRSVFPQEN